MKNCSLQSLGPRPGRYQPPHRRSETKENTHHCRCQIKVCEAWSVANTDCHHSKPTSFIE